MSLFSSEYFGDRTQHTSGVFAAASIPTIFYIANDEYDLVEARAVWTTASSSGTLDIEQLTGTTAPGSGTVVDSASLSTAGTANTVNQFSIKSNVRLVAGDRLALKTGGTQTGLANAVVTITLKRRAL